MFKNWTTEAKKKALRQLLKEMSASIQDQENNTPPEPVSLKEYLPEAKDIIANKGKVKGLSTGYRQLDRIMGGLDKGELIIVGGSTGTGKTLFAVNAMTNAYTTTKQLFSTLIVSMEMTKPQVTARIQELLNGTPYENETEAFPIYFYHHPVGEPTIKNLRTLITSMKENQGCDLVVIDHLHCWSRSYQDQANEIGVIVRDIKKIAIDLEVAVVLISHIRKKPMGITKAHADMDDLRGSSFIAQDADMVIMLNRDIADLQRKYILEVNVAKNRNKGYLGSVEMRIDPKNFKLMEVVRGFE